MARLGAGHFTDARAEDTMTVRGRVGTGTAWHHHGEILQGACVHSGSLTPCLITLPVKGIGSAARYSPMPRHALQVRPGWKAKAKRAARLTLDHVGEAASGLLEIEGSLRPGIGLGSSTCDVVAAIRAVCAAFDVRLDAHRVADIAVQAECAADPIMFGDEIVLFAQRQGRVLESLGGWMPPFTVLSVDTDAAGRGVETLSLSPPQYTEAELATLDELIDSVRDAFRRRDVETVARVATASAELNQRFLPLRGFTAIKALAERHQALGVQISHSGTLVGLLFDGRASPDGDAVARARADLKSLGFRPLGQFATGEGGRS
jgi:uncharacterized protein involved in propanediol utilization